MSVTGLIQDVEQAGGRLALVDGRLRVSRDTGPLPENLIAALRQHKAEIITVLRDYETRQHVREYFEERSAIREYDGRVSRQEAETETNASIRVYEYQLADNGPNDPWLVYIAPGCSLAEAEQSLRQQFGPDRVLAVRKHRAAAISSR